MCEWSSDVHPLQVQLLNVSTGKRFCADLVGHTDHVTCAAISPDSKLVVTGSLDGTLRLWCACCGECVQELQHAELEPTSVSFSPNGLQVGVAHRCGTSLLRLLSSTCTLIENQDSADVAV